MLPPDAETLDVPGDYALGSVESRAAAIEGDTSRNVNLCTFTEKRHTVFNGLAGNLSTASGLSKERTLLLLSR